MLQSARYRKDEREFVVDTVERWLSSPVRVLGKGQAGRAEPGVVVVAEPTCSGGELALDDAGVMAHVDVEA